ncbi:PREDICTED: WD repeat-containing protein 35 isoform X1 [Rhagoletis zephyria]|uniref:WD repeat-containing protein 35 isoform X1 n=1 Tax=Rhagoletis zephyria TaxID=28612 RepID=UPI0008113B12|nr:PREDICTED: WD repeat-containing protein 35 isoform X1 [Rhagoletis zephyria]
MFVYLSKKIAIPNNVKLNCIAWNKDQGYIAVAGSEGLLKVLKLEQASNGQNKGNLAAVSNLSMNQTLDGHKEAVKVVTWNETQQKLTSSDLDGVIMVWMLYKGSWYEEMTNDRKKSTVNSMSWTSDGAKICIVYEDGAIIVGSVDGNRIWGKELKNTHLTSVQWSPDNRLILFGLATGECHLYDNQGNFAMKLNIQCVSLSPNRNFRISALCWFSGRTSSNRPVLAICYETCKLQIMRNESDDTPVLIDTGMRNIDAEWNHDGSVLAICGTLIDYPSSKELNQVSFYSPFGQLLRTLKVPGYDIASLSWEGKSLRIAMAVDSFIYFANIRPDYMWCYFEKTVVFLNRNSSNFTRNATTNVITFWNTISNQSFLKEVEPALGMAACNEHCVIAVECLNTNMKDIHVSDTKENNNQTESIDKCYQLLLCNSIGTTVDSKYTDMRPNFVGINSGHVTIASFDEVLIWHYNTPKSVANLHGAKTRKENRFHIDDTPTGVEMAKDLVIATGGSSADNKGYKPHANVDPICTLAMSEKILLVARDSGVVNEYSVPNVALRNRHKLNSRPYKMVINCNSSRAAVIDDAGIMTLLDLDDNRESQLNFNRVERKDVWAICWAKDNPLLLALMEKTRMYVFRGNDPEEPISCSGYICTFEDLEITSVLLDDIISGDETQNSISHIIQLRVKSLRDTDDLLQHVGLEDAKQFIEDNPHPRLWRLLAEAALKKLELDVAENAFVRCANYPGIQLIKRLRNISSAMLQKAEVAAFYGEFEEAEKLYMDADRRDLAITLRITLCDWFRAVQLYRMGSGVSDQQMETAWREIGNHFASLRSWESAKEYYEKSHHIEGLMDALYHLERFDELEQCIDKLPEKSPLLAKIAEMLASVGMCSEAVKAYLKMGDPKAAVNACVNLRQWGEALQLARKFDMPQIGNLLSKHAAQLIKEDRLPEAIELQKKAGRYLDAARLLGKLAQREAEKDASMLRIKKLYILAALLAEEHLKTLSTAELSYKVDRNSLLDTMTPEDAHVVEHMWHAAEAYHFMMLAQRQLRFGIVHSAVVTALRLRDYDDILPVEDVYNTLALASCADRSFGTCAKAFTKLESLEGITERRIQEYKELGASIFAKYASEDAKVEMVKCYACNAPVPDSLPACTICGARFPACVSSGKPITQPTSNIWICGICHHCATPVEITRHHTCPLCHSLIISMTLEI